MTMMRPRRKLLNVARLLDEYGVEYQPSSNGWLQLQCPLCDDEGSHLGWSGIVFSCFRCGKHTRIEVISALLNLSPAKTAQVLSKYEDKENIPTNHLNGVERKIEGVSAVKLPYGTTDLTDRHKKYLADRNFDPDKLVAEWGLLGTGPVGPFSHRIIIPVIQNGKLVSFQGRDITGKAPSKYKSCPDTESVIPIKSCLYGLDKVPGDSVIVTEGPTKVWRLCSGSVCTFGATVTSAQVKLLKRFRRVFILFDEDEAGAEGADRLARELVVLGTFCTIVTAGIRDVGELSDVDAKALKREFIK